MARERLPGGDASYQNRAGVAYDAQGNAYLAVTTTPASPTAFRRALKLALPQLVDGVFLDGSGSVQMSCGVYRSRGSDGGAGRCVSDMIALKKK